MSKKNKPVRLAGRRPALMGLSQHPSEASNKLKPSVIQPATVGAGDDLIVLISVNQKPGGKCFWIDKKTSMIKSTAYGKETHFGVEALPVSDVTSLATALARITRKPHAFVVRGELLPGFDPRRVLRRCIPNKKTGEPATFTAKPRRWGLVDLDNIACPVTIDPRVDPGAAVEYAIGLLPPECWDASVWWQFSSSQSVDPRTKTLSLHLWFWFAHAYSDAELKRWAIAANAAAGYKLIDPALFSAVQAHYLTTPIFTAPLQDPLTRRTGLRRGLDDAVELDIPAPASLRRPDQPSLVGYTPGLGVEAHLAAIGGAEGVRKPLRSAIAAYVAINGSGADREPLKEDIRAALARPGIDREEYGDDHHLDRIFDWVESVHGDRPADGWLGDPPDYLTDSSIPIEPLDGRAKLNGHDKTNAGTEPGAGGGGGSGADPDLPYGEPIGAMPAPFSQDRLALEFTAEHHADWRYVALWGKWLQWTGIRWRNEETLRAYELVRRICRAASAVITTASLARDVAKSSTVAGVERLARGDRFHAMTFKQFDDDNWSFNQPPNKKERKA